MKSDDEESSFKWCEWWLGNWRERVFLVFEIGGGLEDMTSGDESISGSKIDWLSILKKYLKSFLVDSNLEEVRWVSFIIRSEDWLLKAKS